MKQMTLKAVAAAAFALGLSTAAHAGLTNAGFEDIIVDGAFNSPVGSVNWDLIPQATAGIGWKTTATDGLIEVWKAPGALAPIGGQTIPAAEGNQYAELNATQASSLFQDVLFSVNSLVDWKFNHRGRTGVDVARVTITDLSTNTTLYTGTFSDGTAAWGLHTSTTDGGGSLNIAAGKTIRFAFSAVSSANGDVTTGNLIDLADFGVGVLAPTQVPEPTSLLLVAAGLLAAGAASRRRSA